MFYEAEPTLEEEFAGSGPHAIGPVTLAELAQAVEVCEAQGGGEACEVLREALEEAVAEEAGEPAMSAASLPDPFVELLKAVREEIAAEEEGVEGEAMDDDAVAAESLVDPLEELLAELTRQSEAATEPVEDTTDEEDEEIMNEIPVEAGIPSVEEVTTEPEEESIDDAMLTKSSKLSLARRALVQARDTLTSVIDMLDQQAADDGSPEAVSSSLRSALRSVGARVLEGVFDGERMVTGDGTIYSVPSNYASKSKLVEGDLLKLTMMPDGKLIYKQVGPTDRSRVRGVLSCDERGGFCMISSGARYRLLPASVSFHRGRPGDEVVALIPKGSPSRFAAVDLIMHR